MIINIHQHQDPMDLIEIRLMSLVTIFLRIKVEHIMKLLLQDLQEEKKVIILREK
jgi:hypothetical protein